MRRFIPVFLLVVFSLTTETFQAQIVDDDFNSLILSNSWSWVREDRPFWMLTGSALQITTQLGALNGTDHNNVKNILLQQAPTGVFKIETRVTFSPDSSYHNAGLIYYIDDDNYIRVSRGIYDKINGIWMEWEIAGNTNFNFVDGVTDQTLYLRLSRKGGNVFFASYSRNGIEWYGIHQETIDFVSGDPKIGLQAANGEGLLATRKEIPALFDYFRIDLSTGIDRASSSPNNSIITGIYPNPVPTGSSVTVSFSIHDATIFTLFITDAMGRMLWKKDIENRNRGSITIDIGTDCLSAGIYSFRILSQGIHDSRRIVILK